MTLLIGRQPSLTEISVSRHSISDATHIGDATTNSNLSGEYKANYLQEIIKTLNMYHADHVN